MGDRKTLRIPFYSLFCSETCLFPKVLHTPSDALSLLSPGPAPLALGLCTLQTALLWFWSTTQQHLAAWAPGSFLLLIQKELPVSS